ncbi:MAG: shikimate dehydrogenase [Trueperaceae bacterium]
MKRVELFAYPAWHSLSPAMQNAAFERLRIGARYLTREVPPGELPAAVAGLRDPEVLGANVTLPHKESVLPLLDAVSAEARGVGAVNTIVNRGGALEGHNTDVSGFMRSLADLKFDVNERKVVVLGAGGAGRAVAYALLMSGSGEVLVHNRGKERAERLAVDFSHLGEIRAVASDELETAARACDLLINATSVGLLREGMSFDETPLPAGQLPAAGAVIDLVYRPARTRLLRDAEAAGLVAQNGLPMLVYQGAEAFSLWTGHDAPAEVMLAAAEAMLAG